MATVSVSAYWLGLLVLGIYHGVNPGMGWPLAAAAQLQDRRALRLVTYLAALVAGHELSIIVVTLVGLLTAGIISPPTLHLVGALTLLVAALVFLAKPAGQHAHLTASPVKPPKVLMWSFVMSTAHGAGLLVFPVLLGIASAAAASGISLSKVVIVGLCLHASAVLIGMTCMVLASRIMLSQRAIAESIERRLALVWPGALILSGAVSVLTR